MSAVVTRVDWELIIFGTLVARGLTRRIGRYVSNILAKLHLADRTQAAIYAWREGVMRGKQD